MLDAVPDPSLTFVRHMSEAQTWTLGCPSASSDWSTSKVIVVVKVSHRAAGLSRWGFGDCRTVTRHSASVRSGIEGRCVYAAG